MFRQITYIYVINPVRRYFGYPVRHHYMRAHGAKFGFMNHPPMEI